MVGRVEAEKPVDAEDLLQRGWCLILGGHGEKGSGLANMLKGVLMEFADGLHVRGKKSRETPRRV